MDSLKGHFLVASPYLTDPNFIRTVVLMIHHSEEGAFGVVVNRIASSSIRELWEHITKRTCKLEQLVNIGGPVSGPLMAIHTHPDIAEIEILPGLYFSAQRDHLEKLVESEKQPLRLFIGHSGWGKGQLERELRQGAWFTLPASVEDVFGDESEMWHRLTTQVGRQILMSAVKLKGLPSDPTLN